jgi:hypothetical protein
MAQAAYVVADDWCGVYADGELVLEGHSLNPYEVLSAFRNAQIEDVTIYEIYPYEWLHDRGRLPQFLDDIPQEVRR